jgi:transcription elongation factor GreA
MMNETDRIPLTQYAYDRLKAELDHLEGEAREGIIGEIASARAYGDISENAEYHAAKDQQGLQEARVRQIRQMLENAEIIEADDEGVVKPGTLVTIRYEGDEEGETYFFGFREERRGDFDVLTPESPLGKALSGRAAGDAVVAKVPAGVMKVEITEVRFP